MVWDSSDLSLNYVSVCFLLIIISSLFLGGVESQNLIMFLSLSLVVAGVPDKTKTKEFQVEYVAC